eukprot:379891-Pelagomonas_calceolata.AAC.1
MEQLLLRCQCVRSQPLPSMSGRVPAPDASAKVPAAPTVLVARISQDLEQGVASGVTFQDLTKLFMEEFSSIA